MAFTVATVLDEIAFRVGTGGNTSDDSRTSVLKAANWAAREVWNAHDWPERTGEYFYPTVVPYETGTVDVTLNSANIVGTGTTWIAGMAGRRFALSSVAPWYRLLTFGSTTTFALDRVYVDATATGQTYTIYKDEYDLAAAIESITDIGFMSPSRAGRIPMTAKKSLDEYAFVPVTRGSPPLHWAPATPLAATPHVRRIQIWPVPTEVYTLVVRGQTFWTDMTDGSGTPAFHPDREALVVFGACLLLKRGSSQDEQSMKPFYDAIGKAAGTSRIAKPWSGTRAKFDQFRGVVGSYGSQFGPPP